MTTINSKTTKAELLEAYTTLVAERDTAVKELDEFQQKVVDTALAAADRHGWCSVAEATLTRMGLKNKLPNKFVLEYKAKIGTGQRWGTYETSRSETKGLSKFKAQSEDSWNKNHYEYRLVEKGPTGSKILRVIKSTV